MSWIFAAILSAVFAALVAIFGKIGIQKIDTTLATSVRAAVMALVLAAMALATGKARLLAALPHRALLYIILSGVAGAISWYWYFFALKKGPASGVAALDRLSVVFVLVLAVVFLGESLTWKTALGAALVTVGAIFFVVH